MAGVVGWFMVLRREAFVGHTLADRCPSPGRAAPPSSACRSPPATSPSPAWGPRHRRGLAHAAGGRDEAQRAAVIGTVQAVGLARGFLFLSLYAGDPREPRVAPLRLVPRHHRAARCVGPARVAVAAPGRSSRSLGRPLLFATVDEEVARAGGVPHRPAGTGFLARARARRRRDRPDHRRPARLRAARRPGGDRPGADGADRGRPPPERRVALSSTWVGLGARLLHRPPVGFFVTSLALALLRPAAHLLAVAGGRGPRPLRPRRRGASRGRGGGGCGADARPGVHPERAACRIADRRWPAASSATSSSCGARSSPADALSHVAFTGAIAAALIGVDLRLGLFAAHRRRSPPASPGSAGAARPTTSRSAPPSPGSSGSACSSCALAGHRGRRAPTARSAARSLFGSIFGLAAARRARGGGRRRDHRRPRRGRPAAALRLGRSGRRRLRRASACALLGLTFLALVGLDAAEATQAVGALLLLGLLAAPAGAAHRLTANPYRGPPPGRRPRPGRDVDRRRPQLPAARRCRRAAAIIGVGGGIYALSFAVSLRRRPVDEPGGPIGAAAAGITLA